MAGTTSTYDFSKAVGADIFYDASATDYFDRENTNWDNVDDLFDGTDDWSLASGATWTVNNSSDALVFSIVESTGAAAFGGLVTQSIRFQENTTSTTETTVSMQCGWGQIAGNGSSTRINESVTFPTAFGTECLAVVISFTGIKSDPVATALANFGSTTDDDVEMRTFSVSNSGFTAECESNNALSSSTNYGYTWIAIGR